MANAFNKYYLDDNGLRALIAKIKANDNQLAALIGLPTDWTSTDTTAEGFKSVISKLEEDYKQADNEVKAYIEGLLGYNEPSWPTKDVAGEQVKLTVDERLKGLSEAIAIVSDAADAAFNSVDIVQDNANQSITLTFSNAKGDDVVKTIDTTDFIVHGMLNDVISITIDNKDNLDVTAAPTYMVNGKGYVLPENVLFDLFGKTTGITAADVKTIDSKLPLTYLVMTFGVHPDPNDEGTHGEDKDKEIWVNVSNMVNKQYNIASGDSDLFTILSTEAGGVVTYTIKPTKKLQDSAWRSNQIWDLLAPNTPDALIYEENGEWKVRDIPTIPLDSAAVDDAWNEIINP